MEFKDTFYDKITKNLKNTKYFLDLNSYVSPLYDIVLKQYDKVDDSFSMFTNTINYEPLNNNDAFNIVGNKFKKIDISLYNSYLNILYDRQLTKIINGSNPSFVYGEELFINLKNTTSDVSEIAHEVMHRIFNQKQYNIENTSDVAKIFFVEVNSITFESIINEELSIDKDNFLKERFYSDLSKTIYYKFCIFMYKIIKEKGYIDNDILYSKINELSDDNLKTIFNKHLKVLCKTLYNRVQRVDFDMLIFSKYIVASVLSKTIYKDICEGKLSFNEYFNRMLKLNKLDSFIEGLNILDVNYIYKSDILDALDRNYTNYYNNLFDSRKR